MSEPDPDSMAVQQLAKSGSDLSKLHRVEFHLSFPSENAAADAVARLEELAFATTLERDDATDEWVGAGGEDDVPGSVRPRGAEEAARDRCRARRRVL